MHSDSTESMIHEHTIMVPMRDGVRLATDVFRPRQEGRWPVLLTRVPYNKDVRNVENQDEYVFIELDIQIKRAVEAGYAVVAQDTRGCYASEGTFIPFLNEAKDGADTITWCANQPWSTGLVGMFGVSYQGETQWQAAITQHPALRAIAPCQAPESMPLPYQGGAFSLSLILGWTLTNDLIGSMQQYKDQGTLTQEVIQAFFHKINSIPETYKHIPLNEVPLTPEKAAYYLDWLKHPPYDSYWQQLASEHFYEQVSVPALIIAGWHDHMLAHSMAQYQGMKQMGGSTQARKETRLLIGPWSHGDFKGSFPELDHGPMASAKAIDLTGIQLAWFDHWLKGVENGVEQEKSVRMFVMGSDTWRDEETWPLSDAHYRRFYLHSGGKANSTDGDGWLSGEKPAEELVDSYHYDPNDPVPSLGGKVFSMGDELPFDQRSVEERTDVLCYTTKPLEQAIEVSGPIELLLSASSSALDTDFTGKLVDVYPDGRAIRLTGGILRARYHESLASPVLLEPERIYEMHIDLGTTSNVFLPGHRIRLEVSSSDFPAFDRNTNTGCNLIDERRENFLVAFNRIYHDASHPSYLLLPIVERPTPQENA
jgi:uncharacterized protein